jgi:hypothetical protein
MRFVALCVFVCVSWPSLARWVEAAEQEKHGPEKKRPPAAASPAPRSAPEPSAAERKIAATLDKIVDVDWVNVRLGDVADELRTKHGLPVRLDLPALAGDGLDAETPISQSVQGVSLRSALGSALRKVGLATTLRRDELWIVAQPAAYQRTRFYAIDDLVRPAGDAAGRLRARQDLLEVVTSCVSPESWREAGGTDGEAAWYDGNGVIGIAITHNDRAHEAIGSLLAALRSAQNDAVGEAQRRQAQARRSTKASGPESGAAADADTYMEAPRAVRYPEPTEARARLLKALDRPTDIEAKNTKLGDIVKGLSSRAGIPIEIDAAALAAEGKDPETTVTFSMRDAPLRNVLESLSETQNLTYIVEFDQVLVTTHDVEEAATVTRVYPVEDLAGMPGSGGAWEPNTEPIEELIAKTVAPQSWRFVGGTQGEIAPFVGNGVVALAITQTIRAHESIEDLLAAAREARADQRRRSEAKGQATGKADEKRKPAEATAGVAPYYPKPSEAERKTAAILTKPANLDLVDVRVEDFAAELRQTFGLPVELDRGALTDDDGKLRTTINAQSKGMPLESVVQMALAERGLKLVVRRGRPLITTDSFASGLSLTRLYPIDDLITIPGKKANPGEQAQTLLSLIESMVVPETWTSSGGTEGQIIPFAASGITLLAVAQSEEGHRQLGRFLASLRAARSEAVREAQSRGGPTDLIGEPLLPLPPGEVFDESTAAERRIVETLGKPADVEWIETSLPDVAAYLTAKLGVPIGFDFAPIESRGPGSVDELTSTQSMKGVRLADILRTTLEEFGLTYVIRYDRVLITTPDAAVFFSPPRIYQVHDLVVMPNDPTAARPDFEGLVDLIETTIRPESWRLNGGIEGEIKPVVGPGLIALAVAQSEEAHDEIGRLLAGLRQLQSKRVRDTQARRAVEAPREAKSAEGGGGLPPGYGIDRRTAAGSSADRPAGGKPADSKAPAGDGKPAGAQETPGTETPAAEKPKSAETPAG